MKIELSSNTREPYIIGETACNHEGDINYLYRMIDDISELGLNAVKLHMLLELESYMQRNHPVFAQLATWLFSREEWSNIIDYASSQHLDVIALCDDVASIEYITRHKENVSAIEIHAVGLNDYFLLEAAARYEGQLILGIGGSTLDEIQYAVHFLGQKGKNNILLMYGFQSYPTKYSDINLSKMVKIRNLFGLPVGYADHTAFDDENNEIISVMGAMLGINILEKHYTPDYGKERIDYNSAVGREKMGRIKELMQLALTVHGDGNLAMTEPELAYGNVGPMKKAIVARENISKGDKLSLDSLWFKRTREASSVKQNQLSQLLGLEATRDIGRDEVIDFTKVKPAEKG